MGYFADGDVPDTGPSAEHEQPESRLSRGRAKLSETEQRVSSGGASLERIEPKFGHYLPHNSVDLLWESDGWSHSSYTNT